MSEWQIAGLAGLALSVFLAPIVGRMIHDPARCPECQARQAKRRYMAASKSRHPAYLAPEARPEWGQQ